ncbi:MAG TPA: DUF3347 domain-containing protein [Arachidicoccus sp.]|nr:DUF3347 domain-containing protein [Arachidicoccus sp.]
MKSNIFTVALIVTAFFTCGCLSFVKAQKVISTLAAEIHPSQKMTLNTTINWYLHLKNDLVSDDSKQAASAGTQLRTALIDLSKQLTGDRRKDAYLAVLRSAAQKSGQIADSKDDIKQQRVYFNRLSEDIYRLVKAFGTSKPLYKDYCPMVKASWLSEVEDIKNPYMGSRMPTCGSVKEVLGK